MRSNEFAFNPNEIITSELFALSANPDTRSVSFAFNPNEVVTSEPFAFKARFVIVANELKS